jgi:hypothetical protein
MFIFVFAFIFSRGSLLGFGRIRFSICPILEPGIIDQVLRRLGLSAPQFTLEEEAALAALKGRKGRSAKRLFNMPSQRRARGR